MAIVWLVFLAFVIFSFTGIFRFVRLGTHSISLVFPFRKFVLEAVVGDECAKPFQ